MRAFAFAVAVVLLGCDPGGRAPDAGVPRLPALSAAVTTLQSTLTASDAFDDPALDGPPSSPGVLLEWLDAGYGSTAAGAGEPAAPLLPPGVSSVPSAGPNAKLLVRFVHLTDTQLADDESPTRTVSFDQPGTTAGAFRPQEGLECRVLNAAVRTINALHRSTPIDFVLTGGDNADNAQKNEQQWFMAIMDGNTRVKCDSGDPNDVVPGPFNDGKDEFESEGLAMPWWWVTGNHDVLVQGNFPVTDGTKQQATGTRAPTGTRDYSRPGGPVFMGPVVADAERTTLTRAELMTLVSKDGDGHGIGAEQVASGKAFYSFDVPGTPLRFIPLDTCDEDGDDEGIIHQADLDGVIKPMLDQAAADKKWVVLASHHATGSLDDGSGFGGHAHSDAVTSADWVTFLTGYPNVVFYMVGHTHLNQVVHVGTSGGFWQVMTSALADYPNQVRLVEIWDDDNGWLRLHTVMVNYATDDDPVAAQARPRGVADAVSGWAKNGYGQLVDRNLDVMIAKPAP